MRRRTNLFVLFAIAGAAALHAQPTAADLILTNGKIITVDERISIGQAVAVRDGRFAAVGTRGDHLAARASLRWC